MLNLRYSCAALQRQGSLVLLRYSCATVALQLRHRCATVVEIPRMGVAGQCPAPSKRGRALEPSRWEWQKMPRPGIEPGTFRSSV